MQLSIINDFINFLDNKFKGEIPNILFFIAGIIIGIILFLIFSLIIILISKIKNKKKSKINVLPVNNKYKQIISDCKDTYISKYKKASINEKISGIGKIILNMMESISLLYYPESDDPIFELSTDQLVDFLSYFTKRINDFIDNLLKNKLRLVNKITKYSIKDKKISFVIELINKNKEEQNEKKGIINSMKKSIVNFGKKIAVKIGSSIIDNEFINIIDSLGEDINNLYRKEKMNIDKIESDGDFDE